MTVTEVPVICHGGFLCSPKPEEECDDAANWLAAPSGRTIRAGAGLRRRLSRRGGTVHISRAGVRQDEPAAQRSVPAGDLVSAASGCRPRAEVPVKRKAKQ